MDQVNPLTGPKPRISDMDLGNRAIDRVGSTQVVIQYNQKVKTNYKRLIVKKWFQRTTWIESVTGQPKKITDSPVTTWKE